MLEGLIWIGVLWTVDGVMKVIENDINSIYLRNEELVLKTLIRMFI